MSNIYKITNPDTGEEQLVVSKQYVDIRLNRLENTILQHIKDSDNAHTLESKLSNPPALLDKENIEDIYIPKSTEPIKAEEIKTDAEHKFISQAQLEVLKSKASISETQTLINNATNNLKSQINAMYVNLLNKPDALKKLKDLIALADESDTLEQLLDLYSNMISKEDLEEHKQDTILHMNSTERKALDILIGLIKDGTFDKVQKLSLDFINTSANSFALNNRSYDEVRARGEYLRVYGVSGYVDESRVDRLFPEGTWLNRDNVEEYLNNKSGKVLFTEGLYNLSSFYLKRPASKDRLFVCGCGNATKFLIDTLEVNNTNFKDLLIYSDDKDFRFRGSININSNSVFENVHFKNCKITLNGSQNCKFKDCRFEKCSVVFSGSCFGNMIKDCYFVYTTIPKYIGGQNIIKDNITG